MNFDPIKRKFCAAAHKLLHPQREAYFKQSEQTKDGKLAEFQAVEARAQAARMVGA